MLPKIFEGLTDYVANDEFGGRGNQHTHGMLRCENMPTYDGTPNSKAKVIEVINKFITCKLKGLTEHQRKVITHKHINCSKNGRCRYNFPRFPMKKTDVLEPIAFPMRTPENMKKLKLWLDVIKCYLQDLWKSGSIHLITTSIDEMLLILSNRLSVVDPTFKDKVLTYDMYIMAIRSELTRCATFLERNVNEININNYNKILLDLLN